MGIQESLNFINPGCGTSSHLDKWKFRLTLRSHVRARGQRSLEFVFYPGQLTSGHGRALGQVTWLQRRARVGRVVDVLCLYLGEQTALTQVSSNTTDRRDAAQIIIIIKVIFCIQLSLLCWKEGKQWEDSSVFTQKVKTKSWKSSICVWIIYIYCTAKLQYNILIFGAVIIK